MRRLHVAAPGDDVDPPRPVNSGPVDALRATGLVRRYDDTVAVDDVDIALAPGEVRGLLGPNGAGKTTLLRMLLALIAPDAGTVSLLGAPACGAGQPLPDGVAGFVEDPRFYPYLTGRANLEVLGELDGGLTRASIDAALERVGLAPRGRERVSGYSTGMRQRLGVAAALVRQPRLLLLDEPTSGLDPDGARELTALVRELAATGVAVLLSSHLIGELEGLCDTFTVMRRGRVAWAGTIEQLREQAPPSSFRLATTDDARAARLADGGPTPRVRAGAAGGLEVHGADEDVDRFVIALGHAGIAVRRLELIATPLQAMFLALTRDEPHPTEAAEPTEATVVAGGVA